MEIEEYNYNNKQEYYIMIKRYNKSKELHTLDVNTLKPQKRIFLVIEKGILKKYKIIAYTIINEDLKLIHMVNGISKKYVGDKNTIYITDFMVRILDRKKGIGKALANYIINQRYGDKNILLQPQGDGNWFWKKFGFICDNISEHGTCILRRNNKNK